MSEPLGDRKSEIESSPWGNAMDELILGERLGIGKEAEVYICGPFALKLYKSSARKGSPFREAAILATIESLGLRTPIVHRVQKVDDRWGVLMSRVEGPSFAEEMAVQSGPVSIWLDRMAFLHSAVHQHFAPTFPSVKSRLAANISVARQLRDVHRKALLAELAEMPEGDRLCHGDFHPHNIMGPIGRETIIDWLDAARGEPAADVCRSYVLIRSKHPERALKYIESYTQNTGESRNAILQWLPFVASARLAEGVSEVDQLMSMIEERPEIPR